MKTLKERFESKFIPEPNSGCWLWEGSTDERGYGIIRIGQEHHRAHRISYELYKGPIPTDMNICHHCDTVQCVNPAHLYAGTCKDNMNDKVNHGRQHRGTTHARHILTEQQVIEIRHKYVPRVYTVKMLAKEYGVSHTAIQLIIMNITWRHI